jgi:hypothetical protein
MYICKQPKWPHGITSMMIWKGSRMRRSKQDSVLLYLYTFFPHFVINYDCVRVIKPPVAKNVISISQSVGLRKNSILQTTGSLGFSPTSCNEPVRMCYLPMEIRSLEQKSCFSESQCCYFQYEPIAHMPALDTHQDNSCWLMLPSW